MGKEFYDIQFSEEEKKINSKRVRWLRCLTAALAVLVYLYADNIQVCIDGLWEYLRHTWWYKSVYIETFTSVTVAAILIRFYYVIAAKKIWLKYRMPSSEEHIYKSGKEILALAFHNSWIFLLLDTFHVKSYMGVSDASKADQYKTYWIQRTRLLPENAPLLGDVIRQLLFGILVFDFLFFVLHYTLHQFPYIYRQFHKFHHTDEKMHGRVTILLHPVELLLIVLTANFSMRVQGAHPLTRTLYTFMFQYMLVDNHTGYDLPWNYDKIFPAGIFGGSKRHLMHHTCHTKYYQPFLMYMDEALMWYRGRFRKND